MKQFDQESNTPQNIKENNGQPQKEVLKENNTENIKGKGINPSTPSKQDIEDPKNSISKNDSDYNFNYESDDFRDDYEKAVEEKKEDPKVSVKTETRDSLKTESLNQYSQHDVETIIPPKKEKEINCLEKERKKGNRKNNSLRGRPYLEKKLLEKITQKNMKFLCQKKCYKTFDLFKILEINGLASKIDEINRILEQQICKYKKDDINIISNVNIINNSSNENLDLNLNDVNMPSANDVLGNTDIGQIINVSSNQEYNLLSSILSNGLSTNTLSSTDSQTT